MLRSRAPRMSAPQVERMLAQGVMLEIFGVGVLLTGASGCGKSALALELIHRGHRLVADDALWLTRTADGELEGQCPEILRDFLAVRGMGIVNIRYLFGSAAVKPAQRLDFVIHLREPDHRPLADDARLEGARRQREWLGVPVDELDIERIPGRNLVAWVECAVRDQRLRRQGYHAPQDFRARLAAEMARETPCA